MVTTQAKVEKPSKTLWDPFCYLDPQPIASYSTSGVVGGQSLYLEVPKQSENRSTISAGEFLISLEVLDCQFVAVFGFVNVDVDSQWVHPSDIGRGCPQ